MNISFIKIFAAKIRSKITTLFGMRKSDDGRRMETILNAILFSTIGLLTMLFFIILYNTIQLKDNYDYIHTICFVLIIAVFVALFIMSRRGYVRPAACGVVALYFLGSFYCGYHWGASLPETLLCFALTMGITNLLFGIRSSIVIMVISVVAVLYLSGHEIYHPEIHSWQNGDLDIIDFISYFAIIAFMSGLSWISRWEMARSLRRAEASEKALERERDMLEKHVVERTVELRYSQEKHISELASIAEFGRLSQGLFHDLVSPISSMLLHMEKLSALPSEKQIKEGKESLQRMCSATKKFNGYLSSLRMAIGSPSVENFCSFEEELEHVFNLLAFNARAHSVYYEKPEWEIGRIPFGPADMHQILFNLISNAVDSYEKICDDRKRIVSIGANVTQENLLIEIDDNGSGISPKDLPRIFEQFFTTKKSCQGLGIGLSTVKRIIDDHGGTIRVESELVKGTRVKVVLPLKHIKV
jgi:signal transduction histidine kinase